MLVKFSCGCIGLVNIQGDDREVCLQDCRESDVLLVRRRSLSDKTHEPLEAEMAAKILSKLDALVADGYRFRELRSLLAVDTVGDIN